MEVNGLSTPLRSYSQSFEKHGAKYGVDPALLASISEHETGHGTSRAFTEGQNAMGVSDSTGPVSFADRGGVDGSIEHMAKMIGQSSVYAGARENGNIDVKKLANIYAPVGAENDPRGLNSSWADGVTNIYNRLKAPPVSLAEQNHPTVDMNLKAMDGVNPDTAAQVSNLSKQYQVPFSTVLNGKDDFQKDSDSINLSKQIYKQGDDGSLTHPNTAEHLSNPINLATSKDDVQGLQNIEAAVKNLPVVHDYKNNDPLKSGQAVEAFPNTNADRVVSQPEGFFANAANAVESNAQNRDLGLKIAGAPQDDQAIMDAAMENRNKGRVIPKPSVGQFLGSTVGGFIEPGALGLIPGAGLFAAGGDMVASGVGSGYQNVFNSELDKGSTPEEAHKKAMTAAGYSGLINAAVAATLPGTGKLAGRLAGIEEGLAPTLTQAAKFVASDAALQSGVGVTSNIATNAAEGRPLTEGSGEAAAQQALFSVLHIPMLVEAARHGDLPTSIKAIADSSIAIQKSQNHIDSLDAIKKVVTESKTAKRDPEGTTQFVQDNLEKAGHETTVPVDAQAISEVFYQDADTPEKKADAKDKLDTFVQDAGIDPKEFEKAAASKSDVEVNKAVVATKYADHPIFEAIKKNVSEGMETEKAALQENLKSMQADFESMRKDNTLPTQIKTAYAKMTMDVKSGGLGWTVDEAKKNLSLVHAFAKVRARENGETPEEFLTRNPLELKVGDDAKQFFNQLDSAQINGKVLLHDKDPISGSQAGAEQSAEQVEAGAGTLGSAGSPGVGQTDLRNESPSPTQRPFVERVKSAEELASEARLAKDQAIQRPWLQDRAIQIKKADGTFYKDFKELAKADGEKAYALMQEYRDGHPWSDYDAPTVKPTPDAPVVDQKSSGLSKEDYAKLQKEADAEQAELHKQSMGMVMPFIEALKKSGGVPSMSAMKARNENFQGEAKISHEQGKKQIGLVRNDAPSWDELTKRMAGFGYKFGTPDKLIAAYGEWKATGKDPHWSGYEGVKEGEVLNAGDEKNRHGAFVALKDGRRVIGLMETANMSTFAHEFMHYAVDVMRKEIEAGTANDRIKQTIKTMEEWAGVKDGVWTRKNHEDVSDAYLTHLMEDKAPPSVELAASFRSIKEWMLDIYKSVTGLGLKVSPELSGAFDRMLGSEREVKEAQDYYGLKNNLIKSITPDVSERAKLEEKRKAMTQEQEDRKVSQTMSTYFKVMNGKGEIEKQAADLVDKSSFHGMMKDIEKEGLSFEDLRKTLGDNDANALAVKYARTIRRDGTKTIEQLALEHGYDSPQALLKAMKELPDRETAIKEATDAIIKQKEEEVRKGIQEAGVTGADEEMHSDKTLAYLLAETKALADQMKFKQSGREYRMTVQAYRDAAREYIANQNVGDATRYHVYAAAERKYSREFVKLIQQGKKEEAFAARSKQLLNHSLVLESMRTREEVSKIQARYTPKTLASALKGIENSFIDPTLELLSRYGLTDKKPTQPFDMAKINEVDDGGGLDALMPDYIRAGTSTGDYRKTLTVDQLRDLDGFAQSLIHFGRDEMKSLKGEELQRLSDFVQGRIQTMAELKDKKVAQEGQVLRGAYKVFDKLKAGVIQVQFLAQMVDNFSKRADGKMGQMEKLYQTMIDAQINEKKMQREVSKILAPHMKAFDEARRRIEKERGANFDIDGVNVPQEWYALGRGKWTAERAIALLLNTGNEGNLKAITKGYGIDDHQIAAIAKLFTGKELRALQGVWDGINTLYPHLDKTHFNIYNRHIPKVDGSEITHISADGQEVKLPGGYYPLKFDSGMDTKAAGFQEIEDLQRMKGVIRSAKATDGMTKERVGGMMPPDLSLNVLTRHIADTLHYVTHSDPLRDWSRVTINPEWKRTFTNKFGDENWKDMRTWIKDQANAAPATSTSELGKVIDNWFNKSRSIATVGAFGMNLKSAILIRHSLLNAAHVLDWKWLASGYRDINVKTSILGLSNSDSFHRIEGMSDYLAQSHESREREFREMAADLKPTGASGKLDQILRAASAKFGKEITMKDARDASMAMITASHRSIVSVVWQGAFNKYIQTIGDRNMPHDAQVKEAVKYADSIVQDTQPSSLRAEMNAIQRETGLLRVFTAFMSWNFKYGGRLQFENRAWKEGKISTADYGSHIAHEVIAPAMVRMALISAMTASVPSGMDILKGSFEALFSWIPILNKAPDFVNRHGSVDVGQGLEAEVPLTQGLTKAAKAINTTKGFMEDKKDGAQFAWDWARAAEYYSGVNVSNTAKQIYTFFDNLNSEEKN